MPQLVKGGKFVFAWCPVGPHGEVGIPRDAWEEYAFRAGDPVVLFSASRTSGGFILARKVKLEHSPMAGDLEELWCRRLQKRGWRTWILLEMDAGVIKIPLEALFAFGAAPGTRLLAVRGSHLGLGMIRKGSIVLEAANHPDIPVI